MLDATEQLGAQFTGTTTAISVSPKLNPRPSSMLASSMLLSRREREVLRWLAHGKSGPDTATILDISVCTVRMHIRNIMRKLTATNIPHAVTRGFQTGNLRILPVDE
jgi:DNA-binding CsgD family transcriptional regulator